MILAVLLILKGFTLFPLSWAGTIILGIVLELVAG